MCSNKLCNFTGKTYVGVSVLIKLCVIVYFTFGFISYSFRSSCLQVIFKVAVLKNLAKVIGKYL